MARLVVFDLDGTLLRGATCCERIAACIGRSREMSLLEASSDVQAAREEMARWYAACERSALVQALAETPLAPGAEEACHFLRERGVELAVASVTWSFAVDAMAERLGIEHRLGTTLGAGGSIGHVWPEDKARFLERLMRELDVPREETAAVGDSAGDVPLLTAAGRAVFVGRAKPAGLPDHALWLPEADLRDVARALS